LEPSILRIRPPNIMELPARETRSTLDAVSMRTLQADDLLKPLPAMWALRRSQ
jgi:hypothetical protein